MTDPAFYPRLGALGAISAPVVRSCEVDERTPSIVLLEVSYAFVGELGPAARAVLDPTSLTWTDRTRFDTVAHRAEFEMTSSRFADRFRCSGSYRFEPRDGDGCVLVMEGDVAVRYPVLGPVVERAMVSGLREYLAALARILESDQPTKAAAPSSEDGAKRAPRRAGPRGEEPATGEPGTEMPPGR